MLESENHIKVYSNVFQSCKNTKAHYKLYVYYSWV